jgi:hypothetical protein
MDMTIDLTHQRTQFEEKNIAYKEEITRVLAALEISEFAWRTARGLASDTGLEESLVLEILLSNRNFVERSLTSNKNDEQLFTLRSSQSTARK